MSRLWTSGKHKEDTALTRGKEPYNSTGEWALQPSVPTGEGCTNGSDRGVPFTPQGRKRETHNYNLEVGCAPVSWDTGHHPTAIRSSPSAQTPPRARTSHCPWRGCCLRENFLKFMYVFIFGCARSLLLSTGILWLQWGGASLVEHRLQVHGLQ